MPININNEVVVPPTEEKSFPNVWVQSINISAPNPNQPVKAYIRIMPYNSDTGEVYEDGQRMIVLEDVFAEAQSNESVAVAMGAIFSAVQSLIISKNVF